jgi:hypothetical protein
VKGNLKHWRCPCHRTWVWSCKQRRTRASLDPPAIFARSCCDGDKVELRRRFSAALYACAMKKGGKLRKNCLQKRGKVKDVDLPGRHPAPSPVERRSRAMCAE